MISKFQRELQCCIALGAFKHSVAGFEKGLFSDTYYLVINPFKFIILFQAKLVGFNHVDGMDESFDSAKYF